MLQFENCCLAVIDVQGKLAQLMYEKEKLFANIQVLIKAAKILDIPVLWLQQVPKALGPTVPEIAGLLGNIEPINKAAFSCWSEKSFREKLQSLKRNRVILCGIETHVCVEQTAADLQRQGFCPTVVADAVSSRAESNRTFALDKMRNMGIELATTETLLFELLKTAEHPQFRQIAKLVK